MLQFSRYNRAHRLPVASSGYSRILQDSRWPPPFCFGDEAGNRKPCATEFGSWRTEWNLLPKKTMSQPTNLNRANSLANVPHSTIVSVPVWGISEFVSLIFSYENEIDLWTGAVLILPWWRTKVPNLLRNAVASTCENVSKSRPTDAISIRTEPKLFLFRQELVHITSQSCFWTSWPFLFNISHSIGNNHNHK